MSEDMSIIGEQGPEMFTTRAPSWIVTQTVLRGEVWRESKRGFLGLRGTGRFVGSEWVRSPKHLWDVSGCGITKWVQSAGRPDNRGPKRTSYRQGVVIRLWGKHAIIWYWRKA